MGTDQSQPVQDANSYAKFLSFYSKISDLKDTIYGPIQVFVEKKNPDNRVFLKLLATQTDLEFPRIGNHLKLRKTFEQPNLFQLLHYHSNVQSNLCSDSATWFVVCEHFSDTLQEQLIQRENHLWILASQLIDACSYLEERQQYHGDLRPSSIFLDSNGAVKIAEFNLLPNGKSSYQRALIGKDFSAYLSPQQLQGFKDLNFKLKVNNYKADVYSFGMTLLESALLESRGSFLMISLDSFDCYDFDNYRVSEAAVQSRLSKLQHAGYSQLFANLVRECLQKNEADRPSFIELEQVISEYRKEINEMEPFFTNPKEKVEQQKYLVTPILPQVVPVAPNCNDKKLFVLLIDINPMERSMVSSQQMITPGFNESGAFPIGFGELGTRSSLVNRVVVGQRFIPNKSPNRITFQPVNVSQYPNQVSQSPIRFVQQSHVQPNTSQVKQFQFQQTVQPNNHVRQNSQVNEELDMRVRRALMISQQTLSKQFPPE